MTNGDTNGKKAQILGTGTLIPLGLVITLCAGVMWISNQLSEIRFKLDTLDQKLENQWTAQDMENWVLRLQMANPDLQAPNVDN
jgi:hypothetical protein